MIHKFAVENPKEYFLNHPIPFVTSIYKHIYRKNKNCMILIVGGVGSGKSYIGCKINNEVDPKGFTYETLRRRCVNHPKQFIDSIVDKQEKLKFGSAIMFDEAGTGIPAREWYTFNNKAISFIIQTFRFRKLLVTWTVPSMDLIDKQIRKFFDYLIVATNVDIEKRTNECKIYELSYSKKGKDAGKVYYKYPRYMKDGVKIKIKRFFFNAAPTKLLHAYEKYSQEFKEQLAIDLKREGEKIERSRERGKVDVRKIAEEIILNKKRYFKIYGGKPIANQNKIEIDFGVGGGYAKRIKSLAEQLAAEKGLFRIRESGNEYAERIKHDPEKRELTEEEKKLLDV